MSVFDKIMAEAVDQLRAGSYRVHRLGYELAVPDPEFRAALDQWPTSPVTRLLQAMPDLFAIHKDMRKGMFFCLILPADDELSDDRKKLLRMHYSPDVAIITRGARDKRLLARWLDEATFTPLAEWATASQKKRFGSKRGG
jgi:hypothetical protein